MHDLCRVNRRRYGVSQRLDTTTADRLRQLGAWHDDAAISAAQETRQIRLVLLELGEVLNALVAQRVYAHPIETRLIDGTNQSLVIGCHDQVGTTAALRESR